MGNDVWIGRVRYEKLNQALCRFSQLLTTSSQRTSQRLSSLLGVEGVKGVSSV